MNLGMQGFSGAVLNLVRRLTTKGDLLVGTGDSSVAARLAVGTDGQVLTADSSAASGVGWGAAGGSGTVTSVALTVPSELSVAGSPVTGAGTLAVTKANQSANRLWAGPTTGAAAAPTFRAVVPDDVPDVVASGASHAGGKVPDPGAVAGATKYLREDATWAVPPDVGFANPMTTAGDLILATTAGAATRLAKGSDSQVLTVNASTHLPDWETPSAGGTVSSVALTVPAEFTVAGSPVTGSGTLAVSKANQNAALVYAGPASGVAAAPTFRALQPSDNPTLALYAVGHFI